MDAYYTIINKLTNKEEGALQVLMLWVCCELGIMINPTLCSRANLRKTKTRRKMAFLEVWLKRTVLFLRKFLLPAFKNDPCLEGYPYIDKANAVITTLRKIDVWYEFTLKKKTWKEEWITLSSPILTFLQVKCHHLFKPKFHVQNFSLPKLSRVFNLIILWNVQK